MIVGGADLKMKNININALAGETNDYTSQNAILNVKSPKEGGKP